MPASFEKLANEIFSPTDGGGAPRRVSNSDVQVWGSEVERALRDSVSTEDLAAVTSGLEEGISDAMQAIDAETQAREDADADLSIRIDAVTGTQRKEPVAFATTGNITLSGTQTVDGVASGDGLRALVKDKTNPAENGIWITNSAGAWTRATDADSEAELLGSTVYVLGGTDNGGKTFGLATAAPITVDTTPLMFVQTSGDPDGLAGVVDDIETEVTNARQGEPSLTDRLSVIASDALSSRDGLYATLTRGVADERQWGILPGLSYLATPDLSLPSWLSFSRSSPAFYVDRDGLVKTAAPNVIRHDFDPSVGGYLGALLECNLTRNQLLHTEDLAQSVWTKNQSSVAPAAGRAPDGTMTAFKLVENTASTEHFLQQSASFDTSGWGCWTGWFGDTGDGRRIRLRVYSNPTVANYVAVVFDPATGQFSAPLTGGGATHSYRAKRYKNGWRVAYSFNLGTAETDALFRCSLISLAGTTNYVGDGTSGVLIAWPQVEERRFPTMYVKSDGAMGVREPDVLVAEGVDELFPLGEGMIYLRAYRSYDPDVLQTLAQIDNGSNSNSVWLRTTAANVLSFVVAVGGTGQASLAGSGSGAVVPEDDEFSMVGAWRTNDFAMSANGNSALTDDAGTVPPLTTLRVGMRADSSTGFSGHLRHIALFGNRAGNAAVERVARLQIPGPTPTGQVGVFFGDSITEFVDYPARIATKIGLTAINVGFGGCRMSPTAGSDYDQLSMVRLAEAVASGDWSGQITAVANIAAGGDDNTAILARLMAIDWMTVSFVSIFYGTNDYGGSVPLGAADDAVDTTWRGAINKVVETLLTAYPHLKIMLATPLWRARLANGDGKDADTNPNGAGIYLIEYVDAEIEQAKRHKLPVIDMYRSSGINAFNHATFLSDGLHLTAVAGSQRVADKLAGFIGTDGGAF